jgi:hypothetical protein
MRLEEVRRRAAEALATASVLRAMDQELVINALSGACLDLADPTSAIGSEARTLLTRSTGLSREMVDWGLETSCGEVSRGALTTLSRTITSPDGAILTRARLLGVILSGNVFTASLRAIVLPLFARIPVVAKASSRDDVFPLLLRRAIEARSAELAASLEVMTFRGGETQLEDALFAQADVVAAYGSDATLGEIRGRLPATTAFVPHGHGLGAIWIPESAVHDEDVVRRAALDVAAYDQRGCLSPHAIWVNADADTARGFARDLFEALGELEAKLPRGTLPIDRGSSQLQWRGVATARGDLFEGSAHAVSFEGDAPLRLSPGHRNVSVLTAVDEDDFGRRLIPLGIHLKALGVAGPAASRRAFARRLPPPLSPRVSDVGSMQTPPLSSLADGSSPWMGIVRFTQVD